MWRAFASILLALLVWTGSAMARDRDVFVHSYTRSNGTVVQPHERSAPDHSYNNNWSVSPNVNPYTGQAGTHSPTFDDRPPH